jgi:hypothetical protein
MSMALRRGLLVQPHRLRYTALFHEGR